MTVTPTGTSSRSYLRVGVGVAQDLAGWFQGRPSRPTTYRAMRVLHRHTAGASSRAALAALRLAPGGPDRPGRPRAVLDAAWSASGQVLRRDGITYLPPLLDDDAIARIRDFARTAPAFVRTATGTTRPGTYAERGDDVAQVAVVEEFVLAQPDIQAIVADPRVHELARRHFGVGAVVHPPILYFSCVGPAPESAVRMQLARKYHWDYDGLRSLRLHLYLTDVDEGAAPMQYVAGSQRVGAYRTAALRRGDLGVDDAQVWRVFGRGAERTMTGPAGTAFLSESCGLHRGTDPTTRDRLFLVMPIQATGFAGYQLGARAVAPRDPAFAAALAARRPELRLFTPPGKESGHAQ